MKALALTLLLLTAGSIAANAQTRGNGSPWCLRENGPDANGLAPDCSFQTRAQCEESATGNQGHCERNPSHRR